MSMTQLLVVMLPPCLTAKWRVELQAAWVSKKKKKSMEWMEWNVMESVGEKSSRKEIERLSV